MKTKKILSVLAILVLLLAAMPVLSVGAGGEKVDVCHSEGNGSFHLINISENAYPTHVDHGDAIVGDPVPGMDGYKFDEACVPVQAGPTVTPGISGLTSEAGVRYKGNSTGNEIYLGFGDLGQPGSRVEAAYPDVYSGWPDGTYQVTFTYDGANTITTEMVDAANTTTSLTYTSATPVCGPWDVMDILVKDGLTTGAIAFNNVFLNGFALGNFGTYDVPAAPNWTGANWTVSGFDFSQAFSITGDLVVEGWTGNETNKLQLTVGCLP